MYRQTYWLFFPTWRAQLFRIPPIIIAMQTFPAVYCVLYTVPDRSGKELGSVEVGDGKGGGDEELAEHGEGEDEPDEWAALRAPEDDRHTGAGQPAQQEGSTVAPHPTKPSQGCIQFVGQGGCW